MMKRDEIARTLNKATEKPANELEKKLTARINELEKRILVLEEKLNK